MPRILHNTNKPTTVPEKAQFPCLACKNMPYCYFYFTFQFSMFAYDGTISYKQTHKFPWERKKAEPNPIKKELKRKLYDSDYDEECFEERYARERRFEGLFANEESTPKPILVKEDRSEHEKDEDVNAIDSDTNSSDYKQKYKKQKQISFVLLTKLNKTETEVVEAKRELADEVKYRRRIHDVSTENIREKILCEKKLEKITEAHEALLKINDMRLETIEEKLIEEHEKTKELNKVIVENYESCLRENIKCKKELEDRPVQHPICSICCVNEVSTALIVCGHAFCRDCCQKFLMEDSTWHMYHYKCPNCSQMSLATIKLFF